MASTMTLTVEVLEYFLASSYLVKWRNWTEWKDHVVDDIEIEDEESKIQIEALKNNCEEILIISYGQVFELLIYI